MTSTSNPSSTPGLDRVRLRDWLLAAIGVLFTLAGLLIMRSDFNVGVTTFVFFGACSLVFADTIRRKLRTQRQSLVSARVVGGMPIRPSRTRVAALGTGLLVVGVTMLGFTTDAGLVIHACAVVMMAVGAMLLGGLATGFIAKAYIQFDPPGLTFGASRGRAFVPWSAITRVERGEMHDNQAVFLWVNRDAVEAQPPSYLPTLQKQLASSQRWVGADFVILTSTYGVDAPVLLAAINRYIGFPEARAELRQAPTLNG